MLIPLINRDGFTDRHPGNRGVNWRELFSFLQKCCPELNLLIYERQSKFSPDFLFEADVCFSLIVCIPSFKICFFFFPSCPSLFYSYFLSAFSNLQISMSVKKAQTSVTGASVQTHQGLISVCALMASCHPRIWRPAWVTDVLFIAQIKHCSHTNCSSALIRSRGFSHLLKLHNEHLQGYPRYESWE